MSSVEKLTVSSGLLVSFARLLGRLCCCSIESIGLPKKVLKGLAFSLKFVRRGIQEIFLLFRKVFKMDQNVFELAAGVAKLLDNLE